MFEKIVQELGPWTWWIVGFLFLMVEIVAPGVFFLWIGLAAVVVGTIALIFPMDWQVQIIIFAVLALMFAVGARRLYRKDKSTPDDDHLLNERGKQFVGRRLTLEEPIESGQGRVKIGDTYWRVDCADDLAAGAKIIVTGANDTTLLVEKTV